LLIYYLGHFRKIRLLIKIWDSGPPFARQVYSFGSKKERIVSYVYSCKMYIRPHNYIVTRYQVNRITGWPSRPRDIEAGQDAVGPGLALRRRPLRPDVASLQAHPTRR
jgi:hypothetical protein